MRITYWATLWARAARSSSCCRSKYAPTRLMTRTPTRMRVPATTAVKAMVRRAWNVRGVDRRIRRQARRGSEPRPRRGERSDRRRRAGAASALGEGVADTADRLDERRPGRIVLELV